MRYYEDEVLEEFECDDRDDYESYNSEEDEYYVLGRWYDKYERFKE